MFRSRTPVRFTSHSRQWPRTLTWTAGLLFGLFVLLGEGFNVVRGAPAAGPGPVDEILATAREPYVAVAVIALALMLTVVCVRQFLVRSPLFRRRPPVVFPRYPLRWPWAVAWLAGLVVGIAWLCTVAFITINPEPGDWNSPFDEILIAARSPGPAIALAIAALTWIAFCFRHTWLEYLAYAPGRIEVETFVAGSALSDPDVEQLTLAFKNRLGELHLNAPASAPGQLAGADFLDVLGSSGVDSRNWLGSALALVRAAKPRHAWQIRGVLVRRDERPQCGLTVQVVRLPGTANPPETIWRSTWDDAVRRGADYATAAILPRTSRCVNQWAGWRRYRMPGRVLGHYEDGVELETARRYDEALGAYYQAADDDPMNMPLRLRIGLLQERMGLYLDAFATYQGIAEVAEERRQKRRTHEPRKARRERRRADTVARYRQIILLSGAEFAEQWRQQERPYEEERQERRKRVRERLRAPLKEVTKAVVDGNGRIGRLSAADLLCEPGSPREDGIAQQSTDLTVELRELLALAALHEGERLRPRVWHLGDRKLVLSSESVRITCTCIELRLGWIRHSLTTGRGSTWRPPSVRELDDELEHIQWNARFNRWHEYYNAACLYALPLMAEGLADSDVRQFDKLAESAVHYLEQATTSADSAYIAGQRDWLLGEDPDLDGLRPHHLFKDFEAMYFPTKDSTPFRPRHTKALESARYVKAVLESTAGWWEHAWHERARRAYAHPDVHELLEWWKDECEAWKLVRNVALNNRHWPTRLALLQDLRDHADTYSHSPPEVSFPHYADDPLSEGNGGDTPDAKQLADANEEHLHDIGEALPDPVSPDEAERGQIADIDRWEETLRSFDTRARKPGRVVLAVLCDEHAALWQLLREWVVAEPGKCEDQKAAFHAEVDRTKHVSERVGKWWLDRELVEAAARRSAKPAVVIGMFRGNGRKTTPVA